MRPANWNTCSSIVIRVVTIVFFTYNLKIVRRTVLFRGKRESIWRPIQRVRMRSRH
jgi:hypothetical protein